MLSKYIFISLCNAIIIGVGSYSIFIDRVTPPCGPGIWCPRAVFWPDFALKEFKYHMRRGKKLITARWNAGSEADSLLQDMFDGNVLYCGRNVL